MANRWGNNGNSDRLFIFLGSKITAGGDYSHEIKRHLLLEREVMTNLDSILKSRDITLLTKVCLCFVCSQSYGFSSSPVWMWELDHEEGWTPRNWCFWVVVLKKTLSIPWTARRSNQLILKEINSEYSLEGLILKLKLQYFDYLMWRADSLEKTLMLERRGWQRMR